MQRRHLLSLAAALAAALTTPVLAADAKLGAIQIQQPWARPTPSGAPTGGGYMTLVNTGKAADRLMGGSTPASGRLEVHEMSMSGGVMSMRRLDKGLALAPGASVALKPGGYHLMFIGLAKPLKVGDRFPVTLQFEKAGQVKVEFEVRQPPAAPPAGHQHGMR
jgi:hypothetical protein